MADPTPTPPPAERHSPVADKLVGKAKQVAGSVLGRDDMQNEGQLQQARAGARRQAEAARAEAVREKEAAGVEEQKRQLELDRQRLEADRTRIEAERAAQRDEEQSRVAARARAHRQEQLVEAQDRGAQLTLDAEEQRAAEGAEAAGRREARLEAEAERQQQTADIIDPNR